MTDQPSAVRKLLQRGEHNTLTIELPHDLLEKIDTVCEKYSIERHEFIEAACIDALRAVQQPADKTARKRRPKKPTVTETTEDNGTADATEAEVIPSKDATAPSVEQPKGPF